jgi:hypothetical protein
MDKFYADRIYKNARGEYFTGGYLAHHYNYNHALAERNGFTLVDYKAPGTWEAFHNEMDGKTVRCNYSQIFGTNSQMILCNSITEAFPEMWEGLENGSDYDDENDSYSEIFQYYIIDPDTAERLKEHTDEIIYYIEKLDIYVLGVTHYGTSWDYVGADFVY